MNWMIEPRSLKIFLIFSFAKDMFNTSFLGKGMVWVMAIESRLCRYWESASECVMGDVLYKKRTDDDIVPSSVLMVICMGILQPEYLFYFLY